MRAAALRSKREAAEARLAGCAVPRGAKWAQTARDAALERLRAQGLPGRRDEYWKYTNPTTLIQATPKEAAVPARAAAPVFDAVERLKIVFVDGVPDIATSDALALEHVEIQPLGEVLETDIHWAKDLYGQLEAAGQASVERPLAALNSALATAGVVIRVTGRAPMPISLVYRHQSTTSDAILHHLIRVEEGASLTLLEEGPGAARLNMVLEVDVAPGARFDHVRAQGRDHERRSVTHLFARLATGAALRSFTLTVNGVLTRNEYVVDLVGEGARAHVAGAAVGDGIFHQDDTVFVTHAGEDGESRQVFKKVLRNGAQGVFQGKILVRPGAQRTDGYQISQALLLDGDSAFFAKPELEIYADDVQCSHGSTSGAVDEDMLFYLTSRGVPKTEAQDMLVLSFLAPAIAEIGDAQLAGLVSARLAAWLKRRRG